MTRPGPRGRSLAALVAVAALTTLAARVPSRGQAPATPEEADLLKTAPFDRLRLIDGTEFKVEPISPRPLPPYDPSKEKKGAAGPGRASTLRERREFAEKTKREQAERIDEITVKPLDDDGVYRVRRASIKEIVYFEDMLLAAGERLARQPLTQDARASENFARAFEYYMAVRERAPDWKGLEERVQELLFREGSAALDRNEVERGLRLLRELRARRKDYPGLADQLAKAYGGRIAGELDAGAFAEGRKVLRELAASAPDHDVVREMTARYVARAEAAAKRAAAASDPATRVDALAEALRIWPELDGAADAYRAAFAELPTLEVAVADLPRPPGPWLRSPADARTSRLFYRPLLAAPGEEALRGQLPGQLAARIDSADLGRRITITLRDGPTWDDGSGPVSAFDVMGSLADRARTGATQFQARWAALLRRIEPTDGRTVVLELERTPLKPEAWFLGPIGPAHAGRDGLVPAPGGGRQAVSDGPFRISRQDHAGATYNAAAESSGEPAPSMRRIKEVRIPDGPAAVLALRRGEVSMIEHAPPDQVPALAKESDLHIGRYAEPRLHLLALDGRNPALRNRTLRRGLSLAIDRRQLLEDVVLKRAPDEANRPADGPLPAASYADAPGVRPLEADPLLARMLVAAGRKELGDDPIRLKFEYPDRPDVRPAALRIAAALNRAGGGGGEKAGDLDIEAVARPESELEAELRAGRKFDIAYRVATCPEPIMDLGPLLCPGYDAPPGADALSSVASPRTLQVLLQLEHASEFPTARGLAIQLDRETRDELPVIPLWQLEGYFAYRDRLKGPPEVAESLYDGIAGWEIEPWFARDSK